MLRENIPVPIIDSSLPFNIIAAGTTSCDGNYKIFREEANIGAIEFILEGEGKIISNKNVFYPKKGDAFLLFIGDEQQYYADKKNPWKKIWINYIGDLPEKLAQAYNIREKTLFTKDISEDLYKIHSVLKENRGSNETNNRIALIVMEIFQKLSASHGEKSDAQILKDYIDTKIYQKLSSGELSKLILKSPEQAIRIFKKEFGITPYEYHINNKIKSAINYLTVTDLPIKDIAYTLKFSDEHYFSAFFKSKTGKTPKEFRNLQ